MILTQRTRHRRFFLFFGPLLIFLYSVALILREEDPLREENTSSQLIDDGRKEDLRNSKLLLKRTIILEDLKLSMNLWKSGNRKKLFLHFQKPFDAPDILLYWQDSPKRRLSTNAYLLGVIRLQKHSFQLPPEYSLGTGVFVIYSLAYSKSMYSFNDRGDVYKL